MLAMQFSTPDSLGIRLARAFYAGLARGASVSQAVQAARRAILRKAPATIGACPRSTCGRAASWQPSPSLEQGSRAVWKVTSSFHDHRQIRHDDDRRQGRLSCCVGGDHLLR